jgi:hypothetical protein
MLTATATSVVAAQQHAAAMLKLNAEWVCASCGDTLQRCVCDGQPKRKGGKSKMKGKVKGKGKTKAKGTIAKNPKSLHHHHHHYHTNNGEASSSGTVGCQCTTTACRCVKGSKSGVIPVSAGTHSSSHTAAGAAAVATANAADASAILASASVNANPYPATRVTSHAATNLDLKRALCEVERGEKDNAFTTKRLAWGSDGEAVEARVFEEDCDESGPLLVHPLAILPLLPLLSLWPTCLFTSRPFSSCPATKKHTHTQESVSFCSDDNLFGRALPRACHDTLSPSNVTRPTTSSTRKFSVKRTEVKNDKYGKVCRHLCCTHTWGSLVVHASSVTAFADIFIA